MKSMILTLVLIGSSFTSQAAFAGSYSLKLPFGNEISCKDSSFIERVKQAIDDKNSELDHIIPFLKSPQTNEKGQTFEQSRWHGLGAKPEPVQLQVYSQLHTVDASVTEVEVCIRGRRTAEDAPCGFDGRETSEAWNWVRAFDKTPYLNHNFKTTVHIPKGECGFVTNEAKKRSRGDGKAPMEMASRRSKAIG